MGTTSCIGCGAQVPNSDGPTHKYLGASPGCWKLYGDVLAKEYSNSMYRNVHRLTVDAYALQHVGTKSPQTIQSMNIHLMALCAAFEFGVAYDVIPKLMNDGLEISKDTFTWLTPPKSLGTITVVDVANAQTPQEHTTLVETWANEVWKAWTDHHQTVKEYLEEILQRG